MGKRQKLVNNPLKDPYKIQWEISLNPNSFKAKYEAKCIMRGWGRNGYVTRNCAYNFIKPSNSEIITGTLQQQEHE